MRLCKLPDLLSAAGFGAGRWLVVFGLSLMLVMPALRLATSYAMRGDLSPSPLATPDSAPGEVTVIGGDAEDERRVRAALDDLSLQFDPSAIQVRIVADLGPCDECAAAYLPEMREVLLPQDTVRAGGPTLRWALAHELGHYVDSRYLTDSLRARYMRLRGIPEDVSWLAVDLPWQRRPSEDFGEVFAVLVQPTVERPIGTTYGRLTDAEEVEALLSAADLQSPPSPTSPWSEAVAGQARYLTETFRDPLRLMALQVIALSMAAAGALKAASERAGSPACQPAGPIGL